MTYIVQLGLVEFGELGVINSNPKVDLKTPEDVHKFLIEKGVSFETASDVEFWCKNTSSRNELCEYEWDKMIGFGFKISVKD